jgi:hypothetical protein
MTTTMAVAQTALLGLSEADAPHDRGIDQRVTLYQRTTFGCKRQGGRRERKDRGSRIRLHHTVRVCPLEVFVPGDRWCLGVFVVKCSS